MHTTFDRKQPHGFLENLKFLDSHGVKGRVNRQQVCLLEERRAEDGIEAAKVGEKQTRGANSRANLSAHRDL